MVGIYFKALPNASIARAYFPLIVLASYSQAIASYISEFPPPYTTFLLVIVATNTQIASCNDLSTSSRIWQLGPRKMIEQASFLLQLEN